MSGRPLVSICVPTYNSSAYLRQSLDSIVAQTYKNVEVIIGDNASTDDTVNIANEYAARHGFRICVNERNVGPLNNWNLLLERARGAYVAIYHSDDVYEPTIVEESVKIFSGNGNIAIVGTMANVIDVKGEFMYKYELPDRIKKLNKSAYFFDEVMLGALLSGGNRLFFITPSLMVKRSAYEKFGSFDDTFRSAGDYEMWFRIAAKYEVAIIDRTLINYRIHENQGSEIELRKNIEIPDAVPVFLKYREYLQSINVRKFIDKLIDKRILMSALKQNWQRQFIRSCETAKMMETNNYAIVKALLTAANRLHLKLKL
jgi:glycosyltransferase involved in cell wall biosynthesis